MDIIHNYYNLKYKSEIYFNFFLFCFSKLFTTTTTITLLDSTLITTIENNVTNDEINQFYFYEVNFHQINPNIYNFYSTSSHNLVIFIWRHNVLIYKF